MTTAQETYATMLRNEIVPRLRDLGFRGSGGTYLLPDERAWLLVGFQKNRHSDAVRVTFTVNVTAVDKAVWDAARVDEPWLPERPSGNARFPVGECIRIGALMPGQQDRWWAVWAGRPTDAVAAEVLRAIRDDALPWMQARSDR